LAKSKHKKESSKRQSVDGKKVLGKKGELRASKGAVGKKKENRARLGENKTKENG